ncbi:MAG: hypothetical protein K2H22_07670, partial [Muribaculaceae bacterium]|nr:hypothetical protein [Muribaculaceae bacterium]
KIRILITVLLGILTLTGQAQNHLPRLKYSKEPAVLRGCLVGDSTQRPEDIKVIHWMKYNPGLPGEALRDKTSSLDEDGCFSLSLHTGAAAKCLVMTEDHKFTCYVLPGDTVSFTLDLDRIKTHGLSQSLSFSGILSDFNQDIVYALEKGFDPEKRYQEIERKRNMGQLVDELSDVNVDGYFQYLDSIPRFLSLTEDALYCLTYGKLLAVHVGLLSKRCMRRRLSLPIGYFPVFPSKCSWTRKENREDRFQHPGVVTTQKDAGRGLKDFFANIWDFRYICGKFENHG